MSRNAAPASRSTAFTAREAVGPPQRSASNGSPAWRAIDDGTLGSPAEVTALARASRSTEEFLAPVRMLALGAKASDAVTAFVVSRS